MTRCRLTGHRRTRRPIRRRQRITTLSGRTRSPTAGTQRRLTAKRRPGRRDHLTSEPAPRCRPPRTTEQTGSSRPLETLQDQRLQPANQSRPSRQSSRSTRCHSRPPPRTTMTTGRQARPACPDQPDQTASTHARQPPTPTQPRAAPRQSNTQSRDTAATSSPLATRERNRSSGTIVSIVPEHAEHPDTPSCFMARPGVLPWATQSSEDQTFGDGWFHEVAEALGQRD